MNREYTYIHLCHYIILTSTYLSKQQYSYDSILQNWILINMIFIGLSWLDFKGSFLYTISIQGFSYYYLVNNKFQHYVQFSPLITLLQTQQPTFTIINFLIAFYISSPSHKGQQIIFIMIAITLGVIYYLRRRFKSYISNLRNSSMQKQNMFKQLPIPVFVIDKLSHIFQMNLSAQDLLKETNLHTENNQLKNIFANQEELIKILDNLDEEIVVQLVTQNGIQKHGEMLNKTMLRSQLVLNVNSQNVSDFRNNNGKQFQVMTLNIKQILLNKQKLFLVCINSNSNFLNNQLLQRIISSHVKTSAFQLLSNLQNDYQKWDNMRSLEIIKESDLKLLSASIVELYFLLSQFQAYDLSNNYMPSFQKHNFKFKSLIVYLTEIFAGKYLNKFELIDLYFDESLQDNMSGNVANFSLLIFSLFEMIGKYSEKKNTLNMQCNLEQVCDDKQAFQIQISIYWHLNDQLNNIFKNVFGSNYVPPECCQTEQKYLESILKIISFENIVFQYKEQQQKIPLSEIQIICKFQIAEQIVQNQDESHSLQLFQAPQLQLTFSRESSNHNQYQWKQKEQPKIAIIDRNQPKMNQTRFINPKVNPKKDTVGQVNTSTSLTPGATLNSKQSGNIKAAKKKQSVIVEKSPIFSKIQRKMKIFQDLIETKVQSQNQMLMWRIATIIREKLQKRFRDFEELHFIESDSEIQPDESESENGIQIVSPKSSHQSLQILNPVQLQRYKSAYTPKNQQFGYVSDVHSPFDIPDSAKSHSQLDDYKENKFKTNLDLLSEDKSDIVDFSQIPLNQNLINEIIQALNGNKKLQTIKLIKCELEDDLFENMITAIIQTRIHTIYLQYNNLKEKTLKTILSLIKAKFDYSLKMIYYNSNKVKEKQVAQEIKKLGELNVKVQI
ncbi:hypothetical protein pb186bvf_012141 [Paramecium bursaria]